MQPAVGKVYIVGGLHYGDQGKGTTVDYLVKEVNAKAVVRYGGGPQAAHHVVTSSGIWHCFSHYGSGMFVEKCVTVLSKLMLVYPQTLSRETEKLQKHCKDPVKRLKIDLECYIITPYHQLISRVFELLRSVPKGSTGLGVGRAAQDVYGSDPTFYPMGQLLEGSKGTCIQAKDILDTEKFEGLLKKQFEEKTGMLSKIMKMTNEELFSLLYHTKELEAFEEQPVLHPNWKKLVLEELIAYTGKQSPKSLANCLKFYEKFRTEYADCFVNTTQYLEKTLRKGKNLVFEGSQGSLLDPIFGFFPFVTKTLCTDDNARKLLGLLKVQPKVTKVGVLRCYSHRHGAGPFVSGTQEFTKLLAEDHNQGNGLQGEFFMGPMDIVAAQYGIEVFKPDVLSLTCVDRLLGLDPKIASKIITAYELNVFDAEQAMVGKHFEYKLEGDCYVLTAIKKLSLQDSLRNAKLSQILKKCRPRFSVIQLPPPAQDFLKRTTAVVKLFGELLKLKIAVVSVSPTREGKIGLAPL